MLHSGLGVKQHREGVENMDGNLGRCQITKSLEYQVKQPGLDWIDNKELLKISELVGVGERYY